METAIQALRHLADECENRTKLAADQDNKVTLILLAMDCHWLGGKLSGSKRLAWIDPLELRPIWLAVSSIQPACLVPFPKVKGRCSGTAFEMKCSAC